MQPSFDPDEFFWCGSLSGNQEECGTSVRAQRDRRPLSVPPKKPIAAASGTAEKADDNRSGMER